MLPGGFAEKTGFSESRIRLAITSTLFITYIVYWGTIIFWSKEGLENSYNQKLFETLTDLLGLVLPFYFGATAAVQVAEVIQRGSKTTKENEAKEDTSSKA
jgi:hypothetical protein